MSIDKTFPKSFPVIFKCQGDFKRKLLHYFAQLRNSNISLRPYERALLEKPYQWSTQEMLACDLTHRLNTTFYHE